MKTRNLLLLGALFTSGALWAQTSCADAVEITSAYTETGTIAGEGVGDIVCGGNNGGLANWFHFTPAETAELLLTSSLDLSVGWDSNVHVYTGDCDNLVCAVGDDDSGSGFTSDLTYTFEAGVTYFLAWDDLWGSDAGTFYIGLADEVKGYIEPGGGGGGGGDPLPETFISFEETEIPNAITGSCIVDMNGDFLDDIVNAYSGDITVAYQQPDGSYVQGTITVPQQQFAPSWSIAAGDMDNNGFNDLVYGDGNGVSIMMRTDDGTSVTEYASDVYIFSQRSNTVDINNDGILDAFVCHDVAPNVYFLSDGEGWFQYYQGGLGETAQGGNYGSIWIDYNNDCLIDMFIAKCRGGDAPENINQMHRNNGDGTFTEVAAEIGLADNIQTWSSAWADFDNDGDMDVFVGASSDANGSHKLMRNDDGMFVDVTAETGITAGMPMGTEHTAHDFNNDGFVDIKLTGSTMLLNNGDMTFLHSNTAAGNGPVGDLNDDGYLDIVGWGGIFLNQEEGNNYLKVNTIGTVSNKNGIGARVTIQSALGTQIRDIKAGDGFSDMSSITAHFGLGQDTQIDVLTICWPSGTTTMVEDIDVNQTINIIEVDNTESISDVLGESFAIFPNPTADYLNFSSDMNLNSFGIDIIDMQGSIVESMMIKDNRIAIQHLAKGTYFARINVNDSYQQIKFIKH